MRFIAQAPGKIIITGEHFVVYGSYALAAAIDKVVKVDAKISDTTRVISKNLGLSGIFPNKVPHTLKPIVQVLQATLKYLGEKKNFLLTIDSNIPVGSGLGSSASVAVASVVAISEALGYHLTKKEIIDLAMISERMIHKNPSGIDVNVAVYGGVILFKKDFGAKLIDLKSNIEFVIGYSGLHRRTSKLIQKVAEVKANKPNLFNSLVQSSSQLSLIATNSIKQNDLITLGAILNFYHIILSWLGVSINEIDKMVEASLAAGALGAKVTGGGGGGCIIALPQINHSKEVLDSINNLGKVAFITKIPVGGVKVWSED